jgi:hypothetical protein
MTDHIPEPRCAEPDHACARCGDCQYEHPGAGGCRSSSQATPKSAHVDCPQHCEIPGGVELSEVPRPRHAWGDVLNCPNDGCERSFLVTRPTQGEA